MSDRLSAELIDLLVFRLGDQRYALRLAVVERVVRAVEVTPLPGAPSTVLGVINVQGRVIPVFSLRRRFGMAEPEIHPDHQFLIATAGCRAVALVIDEACGLADRGDSAVVGADAMLPGVEQFEGVVELDDGLALIHDLEKFLSLDEARALEQAMACVES